MKASSLVVAGLYFVISCQQLCIAPNAEAFKPREVNNSADHVANRYVSHKPLVITLPQFHFVGNSSLAASGVAGNRETPLSSGVTAGTATPDRYVSHKPLVITLPQFHFVGNSSLAASGVAGNRETPLSSGVTAGTVTPDRYVSHKPLVITLPQFHFVGNSSLAASGVAGNRETPLSSGVTAGTVTPDRYVSHKPLVITLPQFHFVGNSSLAASGVAGNRETQLSSGVTAGTVTPDRYVSHKPLVINLPQFHFSASADQLSNQSVNMADKPDLSVTSDLTIGDYRARWDTTVVLPSQQVQSAGNGLCSSSITYTVQNSGTAPVPAFTSMLLSSANQGQPSANQWAPLAQGAKHTKTEQILLRPGKNSLTLYLDQSGQLDELNKANNQVRLLVILNGTCNR